MMKIQIQDTTNGYSAQKLSTPLHLAID